MTASTITTPRGIAQAAVPREGIVWHRVRRVLVSIGRPLSIFVPVFFLGTLFTFLLGALSGRSPAALQLGDAATPEAVAVINQQYGLDRPFFVQYFDWLGTLFTGSFGNSWANGVPVATLLGDRAVVSLSVAGLALVIGVVFGFLFGVLAARFHTTWIDRAITTGTTVFSVLPPFVVGIALIAVFAVGLRWLPAVGFVPLQMGFWPWFSHLILPAVALSFDTVSDVARQLRTGLVAASRENYVIGAQVRGLSPRRIFFGHVLRNGVAPALSVLGLKFPALLGGAVLIEAIFGLSGYGTFAAQSAVTGDVPSVQAVLVISIVLVVVFNLLVNVGLNRLIPSASRGV
ncbi:ABC transporter permease [Herbiconiux moechotypicola]|uniref:ABC transporter permease n=1 Tax=Herbiconiux moechotypicola TaxID=637393 RepID=A0ABN3DN89_9MICO|nr:ABC transporter permease [Herbiconiux moechotypicola]MCS5730354.1 ABC transporter permease [Herbiconiux moechotypicola]